MTNNEASKSLTLVIEIDSESTCTKEYRSDGCGLYEFTDPPPSASDVRPVVPDSMLIRHLPPFAIHQLEVYLNLPSCGTMYSCDYVGTKMGLAINEIMCNKSKSNPARSMLEMLASCKVTRLLDVLCELNRLDILITLRTCLNETPSEKLSDSTKSIIDSGAFSEDGNSSFSSADLNDLALFTSRASEKWQRPVILLTHHEDDSSGRPVKFFKWFLKNLRNQASAAGMEVVNASDLVEADNSVNTVTSFFKNSRNIVCVFSESYMRILYQTKTTKSVAGKLKTYLHKLMDSECAHNNGVNHRFRGIVFEGDNRNIVPPGWPSTTIVYEFPSQFAELCRTLF
ncbi:hypothetical protein AB6A40_000562 [Gnathostoma spinigerum]|uniref:TIR domain-containing protein n=1 Tax=Gnathostoma spinigerum TaxID=75299 RepID=A0ABD6E2C9_9BILA